MRVLGLVQNTAGWLTAWLACAARQGRTLEAALAEDLAPRLFHLSFAYSSVVLLAEGGPAFAAQLAAAQGTLLRLARRLGTAVQLLSSSSAQQTRVRPG